MDAAAFLDMRGIGREGEAEWWHALTGPDAARARQKLFEFHAGFARGIARRMFRERNWGDIEMHDVEQAAYTGLLEAMARFDPMRGIAFRSFGASRIRGAIIDAIGKMNEMREQISWRHRVRSERLRSLQESDTDDLDLDDAFAALAEIAVGLAVGFMLEGSALYRKDDDSAPPTGYESAAWKDVQSSLQSSLTTLPERERSILRMHYVEGIAFDQIARVLQLSKGRISQLHRSALGRLNRAMRDQGHFQLEQ